MAQLAPRNSMFGECLSGSRAVIETPPHGSLIPTLFEVDSLLAAFGRSSEEICDYEAAWTLTMYEIDFLSLVEKDETGEARLRTMMVAAEGASKSARSVVSDLTSAIGLITDSTRNESYYRGALDYTLGLAYAYLRDFERAAVHIEASQVLPAGGGDWIFSEAVVRSLELAQRQMAAVERGVPSILLSSMPRAASAALTQTLAKLFGVPLARASAGRFPHYGLVPFWTSRLARGGVVLHDHFGANTYNLQVLRDIGVRRVPVLVRDPRAAAASLVKHFQSRDGADAGERAIVDAFEHKYMPWLLEWLKAAEGSTVGVDWIRSSDVVKNADSLSAVVLELINGLSQDAPQWVPPSTAMIALAQANVVTASPEEWRKHVSRDAQRAMWAKIPDELRHLLELEDVSPVPQSSETSAPQVMRSYNNVADLHRYIDVFAGIEPFSGPVAAMETVDFLGIKTPHAYQPLFKFPDQESQARDETARLPTIADGEPWFEAANWVMAAREARDRFVMMTLGANYGAQAVGAAAALRRLNPMPFKLVCVEPVPDNNAWIKSHMVTNGIDPMDQWLVHTAIGATNDPVLFPIGSPGSGSQNCIATNEAASRAHYANELARAGRGEEVMRNLLLNNSTGMITNLVQDYDLPAEIKLVSAVTLVDLLSPFDRVDYIEADMQQSEIVVFPPYMDLLRRKVRRVHIGTHGKEVHDTLHRLLLEHGFEIVFSFEPNASFNSPQGEFRTNDGVLTAVNPSLAV
jgi:hypothetical protein